MGRCVLRPVLSQTAEVVLTHWNTANDRHAGELLYIQLTSYGKSHLFFFFNTKKTNLFQLSFLLIFVFRIIKNLNNYKIFFYSLVT